ncbi:MAG: sulfite exporter TauE/SafE family protein [Patescibacteria group bacterium]
MQTKKYIFHVHGMHCASCVMVIEEILKEVEGVRNVNANLHTRVVVVEGDWGKTPSEVGEFLSSFVKKHGYTLSLKKEEKEKKWNEFLYAVPIALALIVGFIFLQKIGLVNLITAGEVSYGTAFLIGLVASVSSCLAVVGGLALSLSAQYAKGGLGWKPQILFHGGRLTGFFLLGGIIGLVGGSFYMGQTGIVILGGLVAIVMLILGINLLDIFHGIKRFQFTMPKIIGRKIMKERTVVNDITPFLIGAVTFFLPCGFTQSMQLYALSTGDFIRGALIMFVFALGTLPVLSALSFSSVNIKEKSWSGIFFKTAGIVVIALAFFNIVNILVVAGVINPVFNF